MTNNEIENIVNHSGDMLKEFLSNMKIFNANTKGYPQ